MTATKVLDIERTFNEQFKPTANVVPGTMAFRQTYGMMAFAIGYTDHLASVLKDSPHRHLVDSILANALDRTQQLGLAGEAHRAEDDEFLQNLFKDYPDLKELITTSVLSRAVLIGMHHVQVIDTKSIPWTGNQPDAITTFTNPLVDVRNHMRMVAETLTIARGTIWQHLSSGNYYEVMGGANQHAEDHERFPPTVIYMDSSRHTWSRPLEEFLQKFELRYTMTQPHSVGRVGIIE